MNTTHTKVIVVTVLSMVFGVTKPTFSIPVVVIVKGEVTSVDAGLGSAFSVGDTMTATLTYESSTPGGSFFLNAITASSFTVGSFSGALAPGPSPSDNEIDLTNQTPPSIDVIRFIHAFSPSLPFIDAFRFDFSLVDASGTAFNNASLPSSIALADFSSGTWSLLFGAPAVPKSSVRGDIVFMGA